MSSAPRPHKDRPVRSRRIANRRGFLSMLAAIQGAILLIAAKRSDQIASLLAEHDYETNLDALDQLREVRDRLVDLAESNRRLIEQNAGILGELARTETGEPGVDPPRW